MFIDLRNLPDGQRIDADICIVGAGAAGITLAMELLGHNFKIALLESGGLEFEDDVQSLNDGSCVSEQQVDLLWSRLRCFGGTTGHWGGNCGPLDAVDFEERLWIPNSGWPFKKAELDRFYPKAYRYCELPSDNFSPDYWAEAIPEFGRGRIAVDRETITEKIFLRSPPTRFGEVYRQTLARNDAGCTVYLHANVVEIQTGPDAARVEALKTKGLDGKTCRFTSKIYILASGIENARLLLLSNRVRPNGLGNDNDLVGRYFMAHTSLRTGRALLSIPDATIKLYKSRGFANFRIEDFPMTSVLQPTRKAQEQEGILNCVVFLTQSYEGERSPGFAALRRIIRHLSFGRMPNKLGEELATIIGDLDAAARGLYARAVHDQKYRLLQTRYFSEQSPNPDSRITLGEERDALGLNKIVLDWRLSDLDKHTILCTQDLLARQFGALGLGRIQVEFEGQADPWPSGVDSSAHYMGTTRMHKDPRRGVVDENCRVHGVENLYVAGGSVFPTTGATMVTVNIVTLAVRLADHLRNRLA
jgi:choline dehydrogenase-like flavoprotein